MVSAYVMTNQLEHEAQPLLDDLVNRVRNIVKSETSFQNIQDAVLAEFSELPSDELTQMMQIAMTLAELQGRSEVIDGN